MDSLIDLTSTNWSYYTVDTPVSDMNNEEEKTLNTAA